MTKMFKDLKKWQKLAGTYIAIAILVSFLNINTSLKESLTYIMAGIIVFYYFKIDQKTTAKFLGLGIVLKLIMILVFLPWLLLQYTDCVDNICTVNIPENMIWMFGVMPNVILPIIAMTISAYISMEVWKK